MHPDPKIAAAVTRYMREHHLAPECVNYLGVYHDAECRAPAGSPCTCAGEPTVELLAVDGEPPEGPPRKLRPTDRVLWATLRASRRQAR